jgi:acetoin utilization protein AcuC
VISNKKAAFLYSKQLEEYSYPPDCPFKSERATKVRNTLASMGLLGGPFTKEVNFNPASRDILEFLHTPEYLDALQKSQNGSWTIDALNMGIGGPDTPVFKGMYDYTSLVCGASIAGADLLLSGEADIAFNPSGGLHHAFPALAAGFCYINDVAIACKYLVSKGKKVLYLDIDVHHGDGVQDAFYDSSEVLTISMHETGKEIFPGTGFEDEIGVGDGKGYSVNIPFPPETYNEIYLSCFHKVVVPLIQKFNADYIILELGADALAGDPLAHLKLTNFVYQHILEYILSLKKPLLLTGGGGYNVKNTVRAWSFAWSVLTGENQFAEELNFGLGGVMLESTDWMGGLQDRELPVTEDQKSLVAPVVEETLQKVEKLVFPIHGIF